MSALEFYFGSASWGARDDVVVATRRGAGSPAHFYREALAQSDEVAAEIAEPSDVVGFAVARVGPRDRATALDVQVAPQARRGGVATAMYDAFERHFGCTLEPSAVQTSDGEAFWSSRGKRR